MAIEIEVENKKTHRDRKAGRKADKKKAKNKHVQDLTAQQRNPKAFAVQSVVKAQRKIARTEDIKIKKQHIPVVNRTPLEPAPILVAVVGGEQVGKSTLIRSLIKNYTKQKVSKIEGPITVVVGKKQRLTFLEVKNDINSMVDVAKIADVVLLMIDITIGFEMEVFEFLEICRAYGTPKIMGILNHLDIMKNNKGLNKKKKELTHRFQVELYPGAKLFYLRGLIHGEYLKTEISNLGRFISVLKFRPLQFRSSHSYVLVDRMEDVTNADLVRKDPVCDRNIVLYGYVRGIPMQSKQNVHIPGVGDYQIKDINILDDPCPLPDKIKKRSLNSKERLLYAPMAGVSGVIYDKDAIYIDLGGSHYGRESKIEDINEEDEEDANKTNLLKNLMEIKDDTKAAAIKEKGVRLFSHSKVIPNTIDESENESDEEEKKENFREDIPKFELQLGNDGIKRRKVIFEDELLNTEQNITENESEQDDSDDDDSDEENDEIEQEEEEEDDDDDDSKFMPPSKKFKNDNNEENAVHTESTDTVKYKNLPGITFSSSVSQKSYISFLQNTIYGKSQSLENNFEDESEDEENKDEGLDIFRRVSNKTAIGLKSSELLAGAEFNGIDSFKMLTSNFSKDWSKEEVKETIRDCFVTGEWSEKESAEKLLKLDDEDEDLYGDFEDLESGAKFQGDKLKANEEEKSSEMEVEKSEKSAKEKRLEKKRHLKEFFNAEYDEKGNGDDFDSLKAKMNEQAELNRRHFEGLDDEIRVQYEGYRAGLYVRMEFEKMPCEIITNFDASYPIIVGGLLDNELAMGYIKVRLKVHRWFPKILKNKDPLYISLGWRRFQTMVFYAKREDNFRLRSLKYARKYMHVEAIFWGPVTEMSSGFVAIQDINVKSSTFSIAANGVVLEVDQSTKLEKKLKLIGYPEKIYQKTAFIKDMFHSEIEVSRFDGVKIQTQSKIRGAIKKADGLEGNFRATFEDTIKMSDTVILTTWVEVEVPKFCSIVKNLLLPRGQKSSWNGMKTNAQVKREQNIKNLPNPDSLYTEIKERREYVHLPLRIPKKLQAQLPYADKPKNIPHTKKKQRVFVVKDPEEVKMETFMKNLKMMMKDKIIRKREDKKKKFKAYKKENNAREQLRKAREKKKKAFICKNKSFKKKNGPV
ncbi:UNVERIFIED_CONTAM: hypothetical protein RMT77_017273 [Armadillidium vulgare]